MTLYLPPILRPLRGPVFQQLDRIFSSLDEHISDQCDQTTRGTTTASKDQSSGS